MLMILKNNKIFQTAKTQHHRDFQSRDSRDRSLKKNYSWRHIYDQVMRKTNFIASTGVPTSLLSFLLRTNL